MPGIRGMEKGEDGEEVEMKGVGVGEVQGVCLEERDKSEVDLGEMKVLNAQYGWNRTVSHPFPSCATMRTAPNMISKQPNARTSH